MLLMFFFLFSAVLQITLSIWGGSNRRSYGLPACNKSMDTSVFMSNIQRNPEQETTILLSLHNI